MGWGDPATMRRALQAVKGISRNAAGTITLDSYTRVGDHETPILCLQRGEHLNGYPIVAHPVEVTRTLLAGVRDERFPVQVRHGTSQPQAVFRRLIEAGLGATEGGPVSYCLPYGRTPLKSAVRAWQESCRMLANEADGTHIESFGGCLMGQLCPPSLLIAMSLLECLFFTAHGIRSVSLSYAQGTSHVQDRAALRALRELAGRFLPRVDWHIVVYTYMGLFPATARGATALIADSARLTRQSGCERLIVKTKAERRQIPTLRDNLHGLRVAHKAITSTSSAPVISPEERECHDEIMDEAHVIVDAVLNVAGSVSDALVGAFERGVLDVPYCLHPDNRNRTQARIDQRGHLRWTATGSVPVRSASSGKRISSTELRKQLSYVADVYDGLASGKLARQFDGALGRSFVTNHGECT